jgi:ribonucleoside-diphosphate reductase alpha chain
VSDSLEGSSALDENVWLASKGGGIGTYCEVRGIGDRSAERQDQRHHPLHPVMDIADAGHQSGSLRRGSAACYLDICHPEIEEFLEIASPGDFNRKALNLHHGVLLTDAFMEAVRGGRTSTSSRPRTAPCARRWMRARCSRSWSKRALPPASRTLCSPTR